MDIEYDVAEWQISTEWAELKGAEGIQALLAHKAAEGWELVSVAVDGKGTQFLYLKRERLPRCESPSPPTLRSLSV